MDYEKTLYGIIDKKDADLLLFVGTMSELCEYTGKTGNAIMSAISHSKKRGHKSKYVCLGVDEDLYIKYGVKDKNGKVLFTGNINEVAEYAGVTKSTVLSCIRLNKTGHSKYFKLDQEDS